MIKPIFKINDKIVNEPLNHEELSLELNFDTDDPSYNGQVKTSSWKIGLGSKNDPKDGALIIQNYIDGDFGVFQGIDFSIQLQDGSTVYDLFDGYLDLSKSASNCHYIEATATESGRIDWLNNIADSFTFEYLYADNGLPAGAAGKITDDDFVAVPYLLSSVPDIYTAAITGLSLYTIINQFAEGIGSLVEKVPELVFPNFGNIVTVILVSIQVTLLLIASIILIVQMFRLLVPHLKFHAGMYVQTLCERACEHLGLRFQSTMLQSDPFDKLVIMPESFVQFEPKDNNKKRFIEFSKVLVGVQDMLDFERVGYYRGTFGDLLRELKNMFNAKLIMIGDVLRLERIDYVSRPSSYRLPDVDKSDVLRRFNHEEYYSHYNFSFTADLNDLNVIQNYLGNETQVITSLRSVKTGSRQNIIGGNEKLVKLGFARGIRRTKSTFIEKIFEDVFETLDPLIASIQKIRKAQKKIVKEVKKGLDKAKKLLANLGVKFKKPKKPAEDNDNIDRYLTDLREMKYRKRSVLLLEKDHVSVPKMLLMQYNYSQFKGKDLVKLDVRNDDIVNSKYLYENFHSINSFVGDLHNQHELYELSDIPFCLDDYNSVKTNNIIYDSDGITKAIVLSLTWNIFSQTATIRYKVNKKYTDNLVESIIFSDGR